MVVFAHRHHHRPHPIAATVAAPVFHDAAPRVAFFDGAPELLKGLLGHIGVAHQIVRLADEFWQLKTAGLHKGRVSIGDDAAQIGFGDDADAGRHNVFGISHRKVFAHGGTDLC